jgi:hypothetical protein
MKQMLKLLIIPAFLILISNSSFSQSAPPPPPGGHGQGSNQPPGGGAPLESGYLILTVLGSAYGLKKWHNAYSCKESADKNHNPV